MAKHTITGFIVYRAESWREEHERIAFYDFKPTGEHFRNVAVVAPHSIEVEVPDDFDPRPQQVENLEAERERLRAEFSAKVVEIDRQIASLLALDNGVVA